jgi:hypothetical protein
MEVKICIRFKTSVWLGMICLILKVDLVSCSVRNYEVIMFLVDAALFMV